MELNGWTSLQMLRLYGAGARSARARRGYDRIMGDAVTGRATRLAGYLPGQPARPG